MSSNGTPSKAFVINALKLTHLLPVPLQRKYTAMVEDRNMEAARDLLDLHLPSEYPKVAELFELDVEDDCCDLIPGVVYDSFSKDVLYVTTPTPQHRNLASALGVYLLEESVWVTFV